ncbi:MAG: aldo/keto reductase, partial [Spirochaetales bacterium]|nr:aldo/keto reductase [Spirochaetales bacterium]
MAKGNTVKLGSTGIRVNKNGFGALPIQRISEDEAVKLLRKALEGGMNFFDTSRKYTDSERKLGLAFGNLDRSSFFIATKTGAQTGEDLKKDLAATLENLRT